jgi:hypothetical protein
VSVPSTGNGTGVGLPVIGSVVVDDITAPIVLPASPQNLAIQGSLFPPPATTDIQVTIEGAIADGSNLVEDINLATTTPGALYLGTSVIPDLRTSPSTQGQSPAPGSYAFLAPTEQTTTPAAKTRSGSLSTSDFSYVSAQTVTVDVYPSTTFTATTPPVSATIETFSTPDVVYNVTNYGSYAGTHTYAVKSGTFDVIIRYLDITPAVGTTPASSSVLGSVIYKANINAVNGVVTLSGGLTNGNTQSTLSVNVSDKQRGAK